MLSDPLPLAERGVYSPDVKVEKKVVPLNKPRLSSVSISPYFRHRYDSIAWFEQMGCLKFVLLNGRLVPFEKQPDSVPHSNCKPDQEDSRCEVCGINLDRDYNNSSEITDIPLRYPDAISNPSDIRGVEIVSLNKPTDTAEANAYLNYLLGSQYQSCTELYRTYQRIPEAIASSLVKRKVNAIDSHVTLIFDSNFESGNLSKANFVNANEYDLYLNNDTNTKGHTQWFFFSVAIFDNKDGKKVTFNIKNMIKSRSLFSKGQRLYVLSCQNKSKNSSSWTLAGEKIFYESNELQREVLFRVNPKKGNTATNQQAKNSDMVELTSEKKGKKKEQIASKNQELQTENDNEDGEIEGFQKRTYDYFTLSFTYTFQNEFDKVYFAYFLPYNFTDLVNFLKQIELQLAQDVNGSTESNSHKIKTELETVSLSTVKVAYRREKICSTVSGLPLYMLTITGNSRLKAHEPKKKGVFLCARVHPGESNSSFVIQGLIQFLLSGSEAAQRALKCYVFKIIPMLNPEGVAMGNNRTSCVGVDLNRRWIDPHEKLHPEIFHTKKILKQLQKEIELLVFCDIHGHSKKRNAFMYGCHQVTEGGLDSWTKSRLLPKIFAKRSTIFSMEDCNFKVGPDKASTARVVVWRELKLVNSYTLEVSLHGYNNGNEVVPFDQKSLEALGAEFGLSLHDFYYVNEKFDLDVLENKGAINSLLLRRNENVKGIKETDNEVIQFRKTSPLTQVSEATTQDRPLIETNSIKIKNNVRGTNTSVPGYAGEKNAVDQTLNPQAAINNEIKIQQVPFVDLKGGLAEKKAEDLDWRDYFEPEELLEDFESERKSELEPEENAENGFPDSDTDSAQSKDDYAVYQQELEYIEKADHTSKKIDTVEPPPEQIDSLMTKTPETIIDSKDEEQREERKQASIIDDSFQSQQHAKTLEDEPSNTSQNIDANRSTIKSQKSSQSTRSIQRPSIHRTKAVGKYEVSLFPKNTQNMNSPYNKQVQKIQQFTSSFVPSKKTLELPINREKTISSNIKTPTQPKNQSNLPSKMTPVKFTIPKKEEIKRPATGTSFMLARANSKNYSRKLNNLRLPIDQITATQDNSTDQTLMTDLSSSSSRNYAPSYQTHQRSASNRRQQGSFSTKFRNTKLYAPEGHPGNPEGDYIDSNGHVKQLIIKSLYRPNPTILVRKASILGVQNTSPGNGGEETGFYQLETRTKSIRIGSLSRPKRKSISISPVAQTLKRQVGDMYQQLTNPYSKKTKSALLREKILNRSTQYSKQGGYETRPVPQSNRNKDRRYSPLDKQGTLDTIRTNLFKR